MHLAGYYGLFEPSIAEVLSQAPENVIEQANTFEIIERPHTYEYLSKYKEVINNDFYLSKVRTYKMHR